MFFAETDLLSGAGTGVPASRFVQIALTLAFFALMFATSRRGYWRGPARQIAPLCAFMISAVVAYFLGAPFGHAWLGYAGVPWILRGICGQVLLCLFIWIPVFSFFWRKGRKQVSEKTGEPEHPVLGALVGCWTGIFWGALAAFCIASVGTVGETYLAVRPGAERSFVGRLLYAGAVAKNSLALYPGLRFFATWSPLPDSIFRLVGKTLDVLSSRRAQQRLLEMPEIRSLLTDPAVYPVLSAPDIQEMINRRDADALLSDERIRRMIYDENFQRRLAETDLEPLLDYALSGDGNAPEPRQ